MDPSKWPSSIAISQWFFNLRQEAASNKQPRLDDREDEVHVSAGAASAGDRASANAAVVMEHDDDMTLPLDTTVVSLSANDGGV